jgi:hypothetical protein
MDVHRASAIERRIRSVWIHEADLVAVCLAILDFLRRHFGEARHISYAKLLNIAKDAQVPEPEKAMRAAQYLASPELRLLNVKFEMIEDDDEVWPEPLEAATVKQFEETKKYINPRTGLVDADLPRKLFLYFEASKEAEKVFASETGK